MLPIPPDSERDFDRLTRRRFLARLGALAAAGAFAGPALTLAEEFDPTTPFHRDPRYAKTGFAQLPIYRETQVFGVGTYHLGSQKLLEAAFTGGVGLVVTSPDHRLGEAEEDVGRAAEHCDHPVFVVTEIPEDAWDEGNRKLAFHRALRRSLGRLRRGNVEALLIRNADPDQLQDPAFREFGEVIKENGLVKYLGASGQSANLEKVLAAVLEDSLLDVVVFAEYLSRFQTVPDLLVKARTDGKFLLATMPEEGDLWNHNPGWQQEAERRRYAPWNGVWSPDFTRRSLRNAVMQTPAHNVVLSLRTEDDVQAVLGK